jgi:hypothetical protein
MAVTMQISASKKRAKHARPLVALAAAAVIVLSLSPTGPVPGAGGVGECVANIEPLDVSNRDEVGVGEILTSTSPAERV